ncbi:hypothetical protein OG897_26565 [Streptomyces sp. NBC_00237]|uniref:hypothetical protein n=1 Tax=Streptomyces sp. NBC_00237 TaxID=2975687 RepID=UPI0022502716|nr:hypothetical protein [Streptomyces sp. NBC_00237]MCX5205007.1 hypothetical protein [Streptomyces sp. NBC_00237]
MRNPIAQLFELLRPLLAPEAARPRSAGRPPHRPVPGPRRVLATRTAPPFAPGYFPPLRSASGALVRSRAQIEYERWERVNRRLQQRRRRDLLFASYGIDAGPRVIQIHGMAVAR